MTRERRSAKAMPSSVPCTKCPACGYCFLAELEALPTAREASNLARYGPHKVYRSGEYILHQESLLSLVPIICSGVVAIVVLTEGGEEFLLHALGPGNIIGLSDWLRKSGTSSIAAKAATDVGLTFVMVDDPLMLLKRADTTGSVFLKQIGMHLHTAQRATVSLHTEDAYTRLLLAIRELVRLLQLEQEGQVTIPHKIPRWFFASFTGLRPETVSRMLTKCRKEGMITYRNRLIVIPDLHALESRIDSHAYPS